MESYNLPYGDQNNRTLLLLNLLIVGLILACGLLIFLTLTGYGTVRLDIPSNESVSINDHPTDARVIKMRPGNYQIIISSPNTTPYQGTFQVRLFKTTVFSPPLQQRSVDAIASSVIGATGSGGIAPELGSLQRFDNDTWLVGLVVPGNAVLALHYDSSKLQWVVGLYESVGYPDSLNSLPANVAAYAEQLETQNAGE